MRAAFRRFVARLRAHVAGDAADRDFAHELEAHVEMLAEDHVRRGLPPDEARRQARLRVGPASSLAARHRDVRGFRVLADLGQDLRFAARLMRRERWFTAAAIAAIALGIGANTVGLTIVNAAFLRGFAFDRADELHSISWRPVRGRRLASSVPDLDDWRSQSRTFASIGGAAAGAMNVSDDHAAPAQTQGAAVTANLFAILRQPPLLGRTFLPGEDSPGAAPVVVLGYDLWRNRFDRDPAVIGRVLRVNGRAATVVGVMPEGMKFPDDSELWVPFVPTDAQQARDVRTLSVFGRLAPGVSRVEAATEIDGIAQRILAAHPDLATVVTGAQVETLVERFLNGAAPRMFVVIMGAVIVVLLIACANVANLLLSRAMYRGREVAVRHALGATRGRILRQLLIESVALAGAGGLVGLGLAAVGVRAFDSAVRATGAPYWLRFTIDGRVLLLVAATCVVTGIVFGLAPALQISRERPHDTLKDGGRGAAGSHRGARLGSAMVVAELALTVVLLCGAGLMGRSFLALYAVPPGFDIAPLTRMRMQLPGSTYPTADARRRFFDQVLPKVEAIPGIERAALTTAVPPLDHGDRRLVLAGSDDVADDQRPFVSTIAVSPAYFETLGVALRRGRGFTQADGAGAAPAVVINQLMADRFFPGEEPIGRQLRFVPRQDDPADQPWRTVVGVVPTFQQGNADEAFHSPAVYLPFLREPDRTSSLLVRSTLPPAAVMAAVRAAVQSVDPDQPVLDIETLAAVFAGERAIYRIFATLFGLLAAIGLLLSAVGVYGVIAYAVTQRTQEIGVRMAIGAGRREVAWMFLRTGLVQLAVSLAIGLPAALALGAVAQFQLVDVVPSDPLTMAAITLVITAVALTACVLPARRATRVDPMTALRAE